MAGGSPHKHLAITVQSKGNFQDLSHFRPDPPLSPLYSAEVMWRTAVGIVGRWGPWGQSGYQVSGRATVLKNQKNLTFDFMEPTCLSPSIVRGCSTWIFI